MVPFTRLKGLDIAGMATHSGALTLELVRTPAGVAELRKEFQRLESAIGIDLPFQTHEWHRTWCRHFLRDGVLVRDFPVFHIFRRSGDGECVGIIPLIYTHRRVGALQFRSVSLLGADPAITEIRSPLVDPSYAEAVAAALNDRLNEDPDWDCIQWIGGNDGFTSALGNLRSLTWQPMPTAYVLDLPDTWEKFRANLKRNIRESLRHCYNSLKRGGHEFELQVATNDQDVRAALARLFVLHSMRAALPGTVRHPDHFAEEGVAQFMTDVCRDLAARGAVQIFEMKIAGRVVASRMAFVIGECLYLYYSGFDPAWGKFGVMTTTTAEAIQYAIRHGLKTVNLSSGNDVSKTRWGPREVSYRCAYEYGRSLSSRLVSRAYLKARTKTGVQGWLLNRLMPGRRPWN